jgi:hypothetical protein
MRPPRKAPTAVPALVAAALVIASWGPTVIAGPVEIESSVTIDGKVYKFAQGWWDARRKTKWYEHYWRNDQRQLLHKTWNETGSLQSEETYRDDYLHGPFRSYHPSGKLAVEATYVEGSFDGVVKTFDPSGALSDETTYARGIRDGAWTRYLPAKDPAKPSPRLLGAFSKGQPVGVFKELAEDGKTVRELRYVDGRPVLPAPTAKSPATKAVALRFASGGFEGWDFNVLVREDGTGSFAAMELLGRVVPTSPKGPKSDVPSGLAPGTFYYDAVDRIADLRWRPEDLAALTAKLRELDVLDLKDRYVDDDVHDGTQWHVLVKLDGKSKGIYCSNDFPSDLKALRAYLETELLPHYELELEAARTAPSHTVSREISAP